MDAPGAIPEAAPQTVVEGFGQVGELSAGDGFARTDRQGPSEGDGHGSSPPWNGWLPALDFKSSLSAFGIISRPERRSRMTNRHAPYWRERQNKFKQSIEPGIERTPWPETFRQPFGRVDHGGGGTSNLNV
jgi:hypothetical protein